MSKVQAIPAGMNMVMPHLVCRNATAAIDFYVRAFGAVESMRLAGPDGKLMHAMLKIGEGYVMLMDENPAWGAVGPESLNGSPVSLHLYVEDVDAAFARAVDAGARATMPPDNMFWGDRYCVLADPFGHQWSLATHIHDATPEEMQAGAAGGCASAAAGSQ